MRSLAVWGAFVCLALFYLVRASENIFPCAQLLAAAMTLPQPKREPKDVCLSMDNSGARGCEDVKGFLCAADSNCRSARPAGGECAGKEPGDALHPARARAGLRHHGHPAQHAPCISSSPPCTLMIMWRGKTATAGNNWGTPSCKSASTLNSVERRCTLPLCVPKNLSCDYLPPHLLCACPLCLMAACVREPGALIRTSSGINRCRT